MHIKSRAPSSSPTNSKSICKSLTVLCVSLILPLLLSSSGYAQSERVISVTPASYHYGDLAVGAEEKYQGFQISNDGAANLTVNNMKVIGQNSSEFGLNTSGFPFTLVPGEKKSVGIIFKPQSEGAKYATLQIFSDAQNAAQLDVWLSGNGVGSGSLGEIRASVAPENANPPQNSRFTVAVVVDMNGVNAPLTRLKGYQASISWDPSVLTYVRSLAGDSPWGYPSSVGEGSAGSGYLDWYDFVNDGAGGRFKIINLRFDATGPINSSTSLNVNFSQMEGLEVENVLPILSTSNSSIQITSSGNPADIELAPQGTINYSTISVGSSKSQTLRVRNAGSQELNVSAIYLTGNSPDQYSIDSGGAPFTLGADQSRSIEISFRPNAEGNKNATLRIESNDPDENPVDVGLRGTGASAAAPDIGLSPDGYNFGDVAVESAVSQQFTVRNNGSAELAVSSLSIDDSSGAEHYSIKSGFAPFTVPPGGGHQFEIQFRPEYLGWKFATIRINSNDPDQGSRTISLRGNGARGPDITVIPEAVDFGNVGIGVRAVRLLTIRNDGQSTLRIISYGLENGSHGQMSYQPKGSSWLQPGNTAEVDIYFVPTTEGDTQATLNIVSNDPNDVTTPVLIKGKGVQQ